MTVGQKLHLCLTQLEPAHASLRTFASETQDQRAKQLYSQLAQTLENQVSAPVRNLLNQVETEEPEHRVFQQARQQAQPAQPQPVVRR